jgi:hypothetical protein
MSTHTPGPWRIEEQQGGWRVEPSGIWIGSSTARPRAENEANARLIAAAPEMAEALECLAAMAAHFPTVKTYGNRVRSGAIYSVSDMHLGEAAITVEDLHRAAALLSRIRGDMA